MSGAYYTLSPFHLLDEFAFDSRAAVGGDHDYLYLYPPIFVDLSQLRDLLPMRIYRHLPFLLHALGSLLCRSSPLLSEWRYW